MSPHRKRQPPLDQHRASTPGTPNEFGISAAAYPDGRIAVLLSHYPELSGGDFEEVLHFVRRARRAELQRLRSSEVVRVKLERFLVDQRSLLRRDGERIIWTISAIAIMLFMCWLLWDQRPQPLTQRPPATILSATASGLAMAAHGEAGGDARDARQAGKNVAVKGGIVVHAGNLQPQHVVAGTGQ